MGAVAGGGAEGGVDAVAGAVGVGAEVAGVGRGGTACDVEEEFEEADFPGFVNADKEGGEGVGMGVEVGADAVGDGGEGVVEEGLGEGFLADFEAVAEEGDVLVVVAEPADEVFGVGALEAVFEGGGAEGVGGEDLGAEGLDAAFAVPDGIDGVHGLGEKVVADEGVAEGFEGVAGGDEDFGVVDGVPEVELGGIGHRSEE